MRHYVGALIQEGRVADLRCPMSEKCAAFAQDQEVLRFTDADTFTKYQRFKRMHADPTLRQCPGCQELCSPQKDLESGRIIPEVSCNKCGLEFCFYHSNAHLGEPCKAAMAQCDDDERLAITLAMQEETRLCPHCSILTQKTSGCNHMTCRQCNGEWCWLCGEKMDSVWSHYYSSDNPAGCNQFQRGVGPADPDGDDHPGRGSCQCCGAALLILLIYVGYVLVFQVIYYVWSFLMSHAVLCLVLFCIFCICNPSDQTSNNHAAQAFRETARRSSTAQAPEVAAEHQS